MDGSISPELVNSRETFDQMTDLAPLEHKLIGASMKIPGKNPGEEIFVDLDTLGSNEDIRNDPDLLKPVGLIRGERTQEQIRSARERKKVISGNFTCFKSVGEIVRGEYAIDYKLANPDENGRIPNNFVFQFRPKLGDYDSKNEDHVRMFDQVALAEGMSTYGEKKKKLFSINKDEKTGTIALVFMPLANQAV